MTPTTTQIMDIVDGYGNAEHRQDDGQAVYFRNLISSEVDALKKELDDANERAFMSTESHVMTMGRAMKAEVERDALAAAAKLALDALSEYASEGNWDEDFHRVKRKWLEPDSNTRNGYNGFELAQKAIKAAGVQ